MSPTKPTRASGSVDTAIAVLKQRFAERLQTGADVRRQHASTLTWIPSEPPDAVIWVESTAEVADIVRVAAAHRVPIIPFGAGTSLEGHVNAPLGGLSLDFSRMDRVLAVNDRDLDCTVEAGISRRALNEHLRHHGLFFSVDPGAEEATLGGMAATRASGTTTVRYGTMRDNVLGLTAVMADGSLVRTARRARKSAAGYDLTRLLVGSEGTLGIITELTLRLHGVPEVILAAVCPFRTVEGACNTVIQAIQLGLGLARMELLDELSIRAANAYSHVALEERPTLFLEFHGSRTAAREEVGAFEALAMAEGAVRFDWAAHEEDRRRLWKARHDVYWAVRTAWPGKDLLATDICVPISRLAECLAETQADIARSGLLAPIVGHVGDGNFHTIPVFNASDPADRKKVQGFLDRLAARALALDGTATGEHGIGQGKVAYMAAEHGAGVEVMRRIKAALDPQGILNPGKILPSPS